MTNNKSNSKGSIVSSEAFPGMLLLGATILALILANTELEKFYNYILFELKIGEEFNLHLFVNDFLMAIFFLFVGCEIKRELVYGKLSSIKQASFPVLAAIGGMVAPALIFTLFNYNSGFEIGAGYIYLIFICLARMPPYEKSAGEAAGVSALLPRFNSVRSAFPEAAPSVRASAPVSCSHRECPSRRLRRPRSLFWQSG